MIAYLEGSVIERVGQDELVVVTRDALGGAGVGYRVTTCGVEIDIDEPDHHVALWIHSVTNEFGTRLFGFTTREVRDLFVELLGVKGVGPSTARALVALDVPSAIRRAIAGRDAAALALAKGVGKKTADQIVEHFGDAS